MRIDSWGHDFRYAVRRVLRQPGFSLVVILTLGLGLGANTAVFSVMQTVLLEPLPYEGSRELVRIYATHRESRGEKQFLSGPATLDIRETGRAFASFAMIENYSVRGVDITDGDQPERVRMLRVSADYFEVLGVSTVMGRPFERQEENQASRVALVSERVWVRHLDGEPESLGRALELDGEPHTILGIVSDDFEDPLEGTIDVWLPIDTVSAAKQDWDSHYLSALARLAPGETVTSARAELEVLAERHWTMGEDAEDAYLVVPLKLDVVGPVENLLKALMLAVGLLVLLTAVNVSGLIVAQTAARMRELAVRSALGSGRAALVRQLVIETGILSTLGGLAGVLLGGAALRVLVALAPDGLPRRSAIALPIEAVWLSALLAILIGLAIGVVVALSCSRPGLVRALTGNSRAGNDSPRQRRGRDALVVFEVALALVLLMSALVLTRSFERLRDVDLGMDPDHVTTFQVNLPRARYPDGEARQRFYEELRRRFLEVPGVDAAGAVSYLPTSGSFNGWGTRPAYGIDRPVDMPNLQANQRVVEGDYFEALGIAVERGRTFDARDDAAAPRRVVVSASLARRLFPDQDPVGSFLRIAGIYAQIIGVVRDVPITARGEVVPKVYHHHPQFADRFWTLNQVVRMKPGAGDPVPALRRELHAIDPSLVLYQPAAMADVVGRGVATERFAMLLLGSFAMLAMLLASLGLYGVLAHAVARQRREIGVRMALGARPTRIRRMVVGRGLALTFAGALLGCAVAPPLLGTLESLLFGVQAFDPAVAVVTLALFVGVAAIASYLPARAATRVSPVESFRTD